MDPVTASFWPEVVEDSDLTRAYDEVAARWQVRKRGPALRLSLTEFVRDGWASVEPGAPLIWNWHIDTICEHLEAIYRGEVRDEVINVPPGTMKSLLVCVFWPAWVWTFDPGFRWIFASYDASLSTRDSVRCRRLIQSDWYQRHWGHVYRLTSDQNVKTHYENDATGFRQSTSVGGMGMGVRVDCVVADDPHNVKFVESDLVRLGVHTWWDQSMSTRGREPARFRRVIIMQRLHEDDLSGYVLAKGTYAHLCLPMRYEPDAAGGPLSATERARKKAILFPMGDPDERGTLGELLFPARFPEVVVKALEIDLASYGTAGQLQQRPSPAEGGILKRAWWQYWQPADMHMRPVPVKLADGTIELRPALTLPVKFDEQIQSWDMAFKDTKGSDYVAGGVWARLGSRAFLLAQRRDRLDFTNTVKAVTDMARAYPLTTAKLVEDKANGTAVINTLRGKIPGLIAINPEGGKESRAHAVSPFIEAGDVYLPHPEIAPWVGGFIEECAAFPNAAHDDQVDQMTQALRRLLGRPQQDHNYKRAYAHA